MTIPTWATVPASLIGRTALHTLWLSWRYRPLRGWNRVDELAATGGPVILLLWHNQILLAGWVLLRLARAGLTLTLMVSHSRDGDLVTRAVRPWNLRTNRGSSSRGGQAAMRGLYRDISRHRSSPLVLPDGPQGPLYEVKPGVVVLAQISQAPIVPIGFAADRPWELDNWDRMRIGKPLRRVAFALGETITVPRRLGDEARERMRQQLARELHSLTEEARESLGSRA